jgi:hypothetical protein
MKLNLLSPGILISCVATLCVLSAGCGEGATGLVFAPPKKNSYFDTKEPTTSYADKVEKPTRVAAARQTEAQQQPAQPVVVRAEGDGRRQGWAVVVGVSDYKYDSEGLPDLAYARDDADAVAFELKSKFGWSDSHMQVLLDQDATKANVEYALDDFLRKADGDDFILLYWSGHAYPRPDNPTEVYFACYDTKIKRPSSGYDMKKVKDSLKQRRTQNVVVIADTCHSAAFMTRAGGTKTRGAAVAYVQKAQENSDIPPGWIYMVSAASDQLAIENSTWKNGAFTHVLLKAMRGEADNYRGRHTADGRISMNEIRDFLRTEMPELTQSTLDIPLFPTIETNTADQTIWQMTLDRSQ